ncbi:MAG: hypothetical protein KAX44_00830 [Candidatus Brocadiae bacterium]|nr:hypothetical protein [Candidatus Brocadiia bacterium]
MRRLAVRAGAVVALVGLAVLSVAELGELRGELAFARFDRLTRLAEASRYPADLTRVVENACPEADLVVLFGARSPEALWHVTVNCLSWAGNEKLDPMLRLGLGERALRVAALGVRAAPSDYEPWLWLARAQASLGLWEYSELSLRRAGELAPPGTSPTLSGRPAVRPGTDLSEQQEQS